MARSAIVSHAIVLTFVIAGADVARADDVPELNVDPVCRGIAQQAATPGEKGGPDLAFSQCVKSEQSVRQQLVGEWSTFEPAEKTNCVASEQSALPSYTGLISCLEMAREVRKLNK
ncbi:MAG TPA: hypothetical protein VGG11_13635 [Xanthobacteraceae bacterium]|jgi:hypothetical protein